MNREAGTVSSVMPLIAEAVALAGGNLCAAGHDWRPYGGRPCPRNEHALASQTVYRCERCGGYDYGEPGGIGYRECITEGPCTDQCSQEFTP